MDLEKIERFKDNFKLLMRTAERLNNVSDLFNKEIASIETNIGRLNLGVEAVVDISEEIHISYGRIDKGWHIIIMYGSEKWKMLDAPRWLRIKCIEYVPDLLFALMTETNDCANSIGAATQKAQEIANRLKDEK